MSHAALGWPLRRKLLWSFIATFTLFAATLAAYFVSVLRPGMLREQEILLEARLENIANQINSLSRERLTLAMSLARKGEFLRTIVQSPINGSFTSKEEEEKFIGKFLSKEVESFPFIVGAGFFYEPFAFDPKEQLKGFYARWVPPLGMTRKVEFTMSRSTTQANYQNTEWYRSLIPTGWNATRHLYADSTWTDPYREAVTLVPMVSVLVAMYGDDSSLIGLSSVDWNLDELTEVIDKSRPSKNSVAALFSPNTKKFAAVAGLQGLNLEPIDRARWMPQLLFNAPTDRYEMVSAVDEGGLPFRVYSRALDNALIYSLVIPESEIFSAVKPFERQTLLLFVCALLITLTLITLFIRHYISLLTPLSEVAQQYARGNFKESFNIQSDGEIQVLSDALREYREYVGSLHNQITALARNETVSLPTPAPQHDEIGSSLYALSTTIKTFLDNVQEIQEQVANGATASRLDFSKFDGMWRLAAKNINQLLGTFDSLLAESLSLFKETHEGNFSSRLRTSRSGTLEAFRRGLNGMLDKHKQICREINSSLEATSVAHDEAILAAKVKTQIIDHVCSEIPGLIKQAFTSLSSLPMHTFTSQQQKIIAAAKDSCGRALTIFDQLLGYVRLEEGKVKLSMGQFDLHSLLLDLKDTLRLRTIKNRQELSLIVDENVPEYVIGDAAILRSILLDLGTQSALCTEEAGSIAIRVQLVESATDSHTIKFTISDSGGSIFESRRTGILSLLESDQVEGAVLGIGGGLNIVIAMRLAELMGGSLTFEPTSCPGAQCHLRIQLLDADNSTKSEPEEEILLAEPNTSTVTHQPIVLVVEDDIISQKFISRLLEKQGCKPVIVGDGQEALYALDQQHFDLILMDITLPILDGIETTKRIRSSAKKYSSIPIVAVTGHPLRLATHNISENGFNAYILKPIESRTLREILNAFQIIGKSDPKLLSSKTISH